MLPIEEAIIEKLRSGPCCCDEVVMGLPNFSWGELFGAVDCMSRDGHSFRRQHGFSTYQISLGSHVAYPVQRLVAEEERARQLLEC